MMFKLVTVINLFFILQSNGYSGFHDIKEVGIMVTVDPYIMNISAEEVHRELKDLLTTYLIGVKIYRAEEITELYKDKSMNPFIIYANIRGFELEKANFNIYDVQVSLITIGKDSYGVYQKVYLKVSQIVHKWDGVKKNCAKFVGEFSGKWEIH